jgi:hypothetical protein
MALEVMVALEECGTLFHSLDHYSTLPVALEVMVALGECGTLFHYLCLGAVEPKLARREW